MTTKPTLHAVSPADAEPAPTPQELLLRRITEQFKSRAAAQGFKPGSVSYQKAAMEFYCGAITALECSDATVKLSPFVAMSISVGRDPVQEYLR